MTPLTRSVLGFFTLLGWTGLGVVLWAFVTPSEERMKDMREQEAKLHPARMAEIRQNNELIMKALKEAAETTENMARKSPWSSR